jgi:hypothetical protein
MDADWPVKGDSLRTNKILTNSLDDARSLRSVWFTDQHRSCNLLPAMEGTILERKRPKTLAIRWKWD